MNVRGAEQPASSGAMQFLQDVSVRLSVELGAARLRVRELLALTEGSIVELDTATNELLDLKVNGTVVARGEVVAVNDMLAVRIVEVLVPAVTPVQMRKGA